MSTEIHKRIPWNKGLKGLQPWHNITGLRPHFQKGYKRTEETNKKLKELAKTPQRIKISIQNLPDNSGENHPNWKGGITPENLRIRKSVEFRLWREAVFARDSWTCQKCLVRGLKLHPHHILNFTEYPELRFAIDNGITFCEEHHREFHKRYGFRNNTKEQLKMYLG